MFAFSLRTLFQTLTTLVVAGGLRVVYTENIFVLCVQVLTNTGSETPLTSKCSA